MPNAHLFWEKMFAVLGCQSCFADLRHNKHGDGYDIVWPNAFRHMGKRFSNGKKAIHRSMPQRNHGSTSVCTRTGTGDSLASAGQ